MSARNQSPPRVFLHIGAAKTGTTYLQGLLWHHREALAKTGVHYAAKVPSEHFLAALDLRDVPFAGARRPQAKGVWPRVAERARSLTGTVVISHEVFAPAPRDLATRAIGDLAPAEVHVVMTARDLVRQVTADWQERVKHGSRMSFEEFIDAVLDPDGTRSARARGRRLPRFWETQDAADVLDRWGSTLPPEQVHLVTVPPPGAPRDLLWQRFATTLGIDPDAYDLGAGVRDNTSLGLPETELLRRVNVALDGRLPMPAYGRIAKDRLAHHVLAGRKGSPRLALPDDVRTVVAEQSTLMVDTLRRRGYDVVGDLDDLLAAPVAAEGAPTTVQDAPDADAMAAAGVDAVAGLLLELAAERDRLRHARRALEEAEARATTSMTARIAPRRVLRKARTVLRRDDT